MNSKYIRLLAVGDVVGEGGTEFIRKHLWTFRNENDIDIVVLNGENASRGNGIDKDTFDKLMSSGADIITSGNHIWNKHETKHFIDDEKYLLRPVNYPSGCPGNGYCIFDVNGYRFLVISVMGNVFLDGFLSPFESVERVLAKEKDYDFCVVDIHAEATSEKAAFAKYFDGRISAVFGTHTHVQTADDRVLAGGTGFITDLGMTGAYDSILGVKNEIIIQKFLTMMPQKFEEADGEMMFNGCIFTIDIDSKKTIKTERIQFVKEG